MYIRYIYISYIYIYIIYIHYIYIYYIYILYICIYIYNVYKSTERHLKFRKSRISNQIYFYTDLRVSARVATKSDII